MNIIELLRFPFVWQAGIAGILLAVVAPLIGVFLVHRQQSFLADTLSHSALVGVVAGVILDIPVALTIVIVSVIVATLIQFIQRNDTELNDSVLVLILTFSLSLAVILNRLSDEIIRIESYLFGDLTLVSADDVWLAAGIAVIIAGVFMAGFRKFFVLTLGSDIAASSGLSVKMWSLALSVSTALFVSIGIKIAGALVLPALLIVPVLISTSLQKSFVGSIIFASVISLIGVIIGFLFALAGSLPTGATIALVMISLYILAQIIHRL